MRKPARAALNLSTLRKNGKIRDVPLNDIALHSLNQVFSKNNLVFGDENGMPFTYRQANYALEKACRGTSYKGVQWDTLRHTFASHLAMRGVPLRAIQDLLGHSTQVMAERYAHLSPHISRDAVMSLLTGGIT